MHARTLVFAALSISSIANAGPYGMGNGAFVPSAPDCSKLAPTGESIPWWSRAQWSVAVGSSSRRGDGVWATSFAIVPQASYALWAREGECETDSGLFSLSTWRRWAIGVSADLAWRSGSSDSTDVRPALRLSRAHYQSGFLSVGSSWVPSSEVAVTVGPTFDPAWNGGAISIGGRLTIITIELRVGVRIESRGQDVMLLLGITDLHGLWKLGANRT